MDYKSKNPSPLVWSDQQFDMTEQVEPYDLICGGALIEQKAPDGSTDFLLDIGGFDEEEGLMLFYGIEAPKGCPMREAFEWSDLSWTDFWSHKGWLLRIIAPFEGGPTVSSYISPSEINSETWGRFERLGSRGPYELKREQLEGACEIRSSSVEELHLAERKYREFMARCGRRFLKHAA